MPGGHEARDRCDRAEERAEHRDRRDGIGDPAGRRRQLRARATRSPRGRTPPTGWRRAGRSRTTTGPRNRRGAISVMNSAMPTDSPAPRTSSAISDDDERAVDEGQRAERLPSRVRVPASVGDEARGPVAERGPGLLVVVTSDQRRGSPARAGRRRAPPPEDAVAAAPPRRAGIGAVDDSSRWSSARPRVLRGARSTRSRPRPDAPVRLVGQPWILSSWAMALLGRSAGQRRRSPRPRRSAWPVGRAR